MHDDTVKLLASIESTVPGLIYRTEGNYALNPLVWDVGTQGEFSISRLLESTGNLVPIELDDFLGWQEYLEDFEHWHEFLEQNPDYLTQEEPSSYWMSIAERPYFIQFQAEEYEAFLSESVVMAQRYRSLLDILKAYTTYLQVYRVVKYDDTIPCRDEAEIREFYLDNDFSDDEIAEHEAQIDEANLQTEDYSNDRRSSKCVFESFKILVGKVSDDCWIGISPILVNVSHYLEFMNLRSPEKFVSQCISRQDTEALKSELEPILDTLTFIQRNFYDSYEKDKMYICEFARTKEAAINILLHRSRFLKTGEFDSFGTKGEGDDDYDREDKFDEIDRLLKSNFKNLRIHVAGTMSMFDIYAIGQAESGDWLGASTTAIWTG